MANDGLDALNEDLERWETAYELVMLRGYSYRKASKEMLCTPESVKRWALKYRTILKSVREESDKLDMTADFEAAVFRTIQQAEDVYTDAAKDKQRLVQVAALNAKKSQLDLLMKVRGLEAPKEVKGDVSGDFVVRWADDEPDSESGSES